jgi:hypothetical protein
MLFVWFTVGLAHDSAYVIGYLDTR